MTPEPEYGLVGLALAAIRTVLAFVRGRRPTPEAPAQPVSKARVRSKSTRRPKSGIEVNLRIGRY
jgi:hypothetical protein